MAKAARTARIELRTTPEEKELLTQAAARERLDVTTFIMRAALPAARDSLELPERIVLSDRDAMRVLDLLSNPPPPTEALVEAIRRRLSR